MEQASFYSSEAERNRGCLAAIALFFAVFTVYPSVAAAQTLIVLRQGLNGYSGAEDATLFEEYSSHSAGGFPYLFAGTTKFSNARRSLLKFDLQGIVPPTANVTSASLQLFLEYGNSGSFIFSLHPMTRAWNEGSNPLLDPATVGQGAPAQPGDTTWSHVSYNATPWTTAGGEFAAPASATGSAGNVGAFLHFSGAGLASDVQTWLTAPSANYGWALLGNETTAQTAKRFWSSESDNAASSLRPQLSIEFETQSLVQDWALYQ